MRKGDSSALPGIHPLLCVMMPLRTTIISGDVIFWGESLPTSLPDLYKYPEQEPLIRLKHNRFFRLLHFKPKDYWISLVIELPILRKSAMTLNKGDKLRNMDKRRGSVPFPMNLPNLHRRSMPVDDRDLRATMPQTGQTDELSNLLRCTSYSQSEQHRGSCASDSSDSVISTGSETESTLHKVVLLGEHGVGKSSLARVFGGVEDAGHDCDEAGNTYDRSIVVDEEESCIVLYDIWEQDNSQWLKEQCMRMGDAYIIVYSVTDKSSFEKASELRIQLRRARQSENIPIILVGNKSDLVRSREVSVDEGSACAVVFDCKFIETSASLHHNVHDLFEGIVRQIRLRKDSKEENARRMANCRRRESIGKKAKRFLGRMVARKNKKMAFRQKSKSCHDLTVL